MSEPEATGALMRGLRCGIAAILLALLLVMLPTLLAFKVVYHPMAIEAAAYGCLLLVAVALAVFVLTGHAITGGLRWLPMVATTLATLAAAYAVPAGALLGPAHWSWRVVGWFPTLLFLDRPMWLTLSLLAGQQSLVVGQLILAGRTDRASIVQWGIIAAAHTGAQLTLAVGGRVARRVGAAADLAARRAAELRTSSMIADQVLADHHARYADIAGTTIPLLEGLRDGRLRPSDPATQLQCSIEAARLRRLMAEGDDVVDPLVHELRACVDVTERTGVRVDLAARGSGPPLDQALRRRLTEPVITVLAQARSHARVTVVASPRGVIVSVLADMRTGTAHVDISAAPAGLSLTTAADGSDVDLSVVRLDGRVYLTARWGAP